jgi:hypothetical protein
VAGSSFFALLDDISVLLDDVAVMTKVAAKKTAGVLGDDLALNADQVAGVNADRELPVVWAVAKGSLVNKAILVPCALAISAVAPWAISPLLMLGGSYLCFEGAEKLAHKLLHPPEVEEQHKEMLRAAVADPAVDIGAYERDKVKGAIRTDFILSAEIIVISLGSIADASFGKRVAALVAIAIVMTVGVYGAVAAIVKLDDAGFALRRRDSSVLQAMGNFLVSLAPWLMKALSVAGTVAMFLVGGGIVVHGIGALHHLRDAAEKASGVVAPLTHNVFNGVAGIVIGAVLVAVMTLVSRLRKGATPAAS